MRYQTVDSSFVLSYVVYLLCLWFVVYSVCLPRVGYGTFWELVFDCFKDYLTTHYFRQSITGLASAAVKKKIMGVMVWYCSVRYKELTLGIRGFVIIYSIIFMPTAFLADGHIVLPGILNSLFISFSLSLSLYISVIGFTFKFFVWV